VRASACVRVCLIESESERERERERERVGIVIEASVVTQPVPSCVVAHLRVALQSE